MRELLHILAAYIGAFWWVALVAYFTYALLSKLGDAGLAR